MCIFSRYLLLLLSSGGFMQRQMSPTEGLVKVVKVKMKSLSVPEMSLKTLTTMTDLFEAVTDCVFS